MPEVRLTFRAGGAAHVLAAGCAVEAAGAAVVAAPEGHRPIAHAEVARARLAAASMAHARRALERGTWQQKQPSWGKDAD